jgi:hypothetical protein|tara:strand:+ start:3474 stop:3809 length:336 start_codon:yes stop_codon:yes gene_type:complete
MMMSISLETSAWNSKLSEPDANCLSLWDTTFGASSVKSASARAAAVFFYFLFFEWSVSAFRWVAMKEKRDDGQGWRRCGCVGAVVRDATNTSRSRIEWCLSIIVEVIDRDF